MTVRNYDYSWLPKGYTLFVELNKGYSDPRDGHSPDSVRVRLKNEVGETYTSTNVVSEYGGQITSIDSINDHNLAMAFDVLKLSYSKTKATAEYLGTHPRP